MTVPQQSYGFANGRAQVMSKSLLTAQAIERLVSLDTVEDVARALAELNFGDVRSKGDIERVSAGNTADAAKFVRDVTPEPAATDPFLIRYDALNLKLLLKGRILGADISALPLSACGLIEVDRLTRMVSENRYGDLPPELKEAMDRIEKRVSVSMDPLYVDAEIDKATWRYIARRLADVHDPVINEYFASRADLINLTIALRVNGLKKGGAFARELFVPYGTFSVDALTAVANEADRAAALVTGKPYAREAQAILRSAPYDLSALERIADDYLLALFRAHKYENQTVLPLIGYLLAREREAGAVRLIASAKTAHVGGAELLKRLRAMY